MSSWPSRSIAAGSARESRRLASPTSASDIPAVVVQALCERLAYRAAVNAGLGPEAEGSPVTNGLLRVVHQHEQGVREDFSVPAIAT